MESCIVETTMADLQKGDQVLGTDGKYHDIEILPPQVIQLYRLSTTAGSIKCSWNHYWIVIDKDNFFVTVTMAEIYGDLKRFKGMRIGTLEGPIITGAEMLEKAECRCIKVKDTKDQQFQILTEQGNPIFTHNCQMRMVCGRLDTTASLMALDNSLATAIDKDRKGAGLVSSNAIVSNCQYYYAKPEWIDDWYKKHGMDNKGYFKRTAEEEHSITLGDDEEEFSLSDNDVSYELDNVEKDIKNRQEQKFHNV